MTDSTLYEILHERVFPSGRKVMTVEYDVSESNEPQTATLYTADALQVLILPTVAGDVLHFETHWFVDGERVAPITIIPDTPNACVEHTLRRPDAVT